MNIGIIDAEIIGKTRNRFPNLASMKISAYHKSIGDTVSLVLSYDDIDKYDKVYISKVFIKTDVPCEPETKDKTEQNVVDYYSTNSFLQNPKIKYGGTGFYYEKAPALPDEIEHIMPDYHLYDEWIEQCIKDGAKERKFTYYKDYSIGFLTRGCFRQCEFCINKLYKKSIPHSDLYEFYDSSRPKLCFLDDNFFACSDWENIIAKVLETKRRFQFKQGLDERLLDKHKIDSIKTWLKKYDKGLIFAFDNVEDKDLIISKLDMLYEEIPNLKHQLMFYCFCGYDRNGIYDEDFWLNDIKNLFVRFFILAKYSALPYVMKHENYKNSPYYSLCRAISSYANAPLYYSKFTFKEYCEWKGMKESVRKEYEQRQHEYLLKYPKYAPWTYLDDFNEKTNNEFQEFFNTLPFSLAEYGVYKK